MNDTALSQQVGGSHYKDMAIQPVEFIEKNNLGFCAGNVIKYICRYKNKNGIEDLKKARHYIDLLIEIETAIEDSIIKEETAGCYISKEEMSKLQKDFINTQLEQLN